MNSNNFCGIHFARQMCCLRVRKTSTREHILLQRHQDASYLMGMNGTDYILNFIFINYLILLPIRASLQTG